MALSGRTVVFGTLAFASSSAATGLAVLQFNPPTLVHWAIGCVVVLASTAAATTGAQWTHHQRHHQELDAAIHEVASTMIESLAAAEGMISVIIYLPAKCGALMPSYSHNVPGTFVDQPTYDTWQGPVGHAWGAAEQTIIQPAQTTREELRRVWKLRPQQVNSISHSQEIVATPILIRTREGYREPIGVMCVAQAPGAFGPLLSSAHALSLMRNSATAIGVILSR
jgi:hypothetical protein